MYRVVRVEIARTPTPRRGTRVAVLGGTRTTGGVLRRSHPGSHSRKSGRRVSGTPPIRFHDFAGTFPLPTSGGWNLPLVRGACPPNTSAHCAEHRRNLDALTYDAEAALPSFVLCELDARGGAAASDRTAASQADEPGLLRRRLRGRRRRFLAPLPGTATSSPLEHFRPTGRGGLLCVQDDAPGPTSLHDASMQSRMRVPLCAVPPCAVCTVRYQHAVSA